MSPLLYYALHHGKERNGESELDMAVEVGLLYYVSVLWTQLKKKRKAFFYYK